MILYPTKKLCTLKETTNKTIGKTQLQIILSDKELISKLNKVLIQLSIKNKYSG